MGWELMAMPLYEAAKPELWDAFVGFDIARLPASPPTGLRPMTVASLVEGLRRSDVAGYVSLPVAGLDTTDILREWDHLAADDEWGVGAVSLQVEGRGYRDALAPTDPITLVTFDKPHPNSALTAACAVDESGPLVVFDSALRGICVSAGERVEDVRPHWPRES